MKIWLHKFNFKFKWNLNRNSNFPPILCDTYDINRDHVCAFFQLWSFEKLEVQTSFFLFSLSKFHSSLSLHSSSPTFKLLSMASYDDELLLDSSSPWSGISNHISSFSILLPLIFKKQRTLLMNKIQGLEAPHGATSPILIIPTHSPS